MMKLYSFNLLVGIISEVKRSIIQIVKCYARGNGHHILLMKLLLTGLRKGFVANIPQ
jgi:hypothetical protein